MAVAETVGLFITHPVCPVGTLSEEHHGPGNWWLGKHSPFQNKSWGRLACGAKKSCLPLRCLAQERTWLYQRQAGSHGPRQPAQAKPPVRFSKGGPASRKLQGIGPPPGETSNQILIQRGKPSSGISSSNSRMYQVIQLPLVVK